ncbi:hypothetical protein ACGFYV_35635 [Streptomyces sp. NPDC048297]|uniref:hypothetical protein n=1 Tax=Streptomyces sp. NPDC048297 TaxID=3365531 RepID=UPI003712C6FE
MTDPTTTPGTTLGTTAGTARGTAAGATWPAGATAATATVVRLGLGLVDASGRDTASDLDRLDDGTPR